MEGSWGSLRECGNAPLPWGTHSWGTGTYVYVHPSSGGVLVMRGGWEAGVRAILSALVPVLILWWKGWVLSGPLCLPGSLTYWGVMQTLRYRP